MSNTTAGTMGDETTRLSRFDERVLEVLIGSDGASCAYVKWKLSCEKDKVRESLNSLAETGLVMDLGNTDQWRLTDDGQGYVS